MRLLVNFFVAYSFTYSFVLYRNTMYISCKAQKKKKLRYNMKINEYQYFDEIIFAAVS